MSNTLKPFEPLQLSEALHTFIKEMMGRRRSNVETIEQLSQANTAIMTHVWDQINAAFPEAKGQNMVCNRREDGSYMVSLMYDKKEIPSSNDRVRLLLAGLEDEGISRSQILGMLES